MCITRVGYITVSTGDGRAGGGGRYHVTGQTSRVGQAVTVT